MSIFFYFKLSGLFASFRKVDINETYITYQNPPIPTLIGMLGAINGYKGLMEVQKGKLPEYYEKFIGLYIGILPSFLINENKFPNKTILTYNNSTGLASSKGNTLQIKEQILIKPEWYIFVYDPNDLESTKLLRENLRRNTCVYVPYLGKNEFKAEISEFNNLEEHLKKEVKDIKDINSIEGIISMLSYKIITKSRDEMPIDEAKKIKFMYLLENLPIKLSNNSDRQFSETFAFLKGQVVNININKLNQYDSYKLFNYREAFNNGENIWISLLRVS